MTARVGKDLGEGGVHGQLPAGMEERRQERERERTLAHGRVRHAAPATVIAAAAPVTALRRFSDRRSTSPYDAPNWQELKNVEDLTLDVEAGEADASIRGNGGWRAVPATLKNVRSSSSGTAAMTAAGRLHR